MIEEDFDTRIRECDIDEGEFETFRDAQDAAFEYLESLIALCESTLAEIRHAGSYDEYVRN